MATLQPSLQGSASSIKTNQLLIISTEHHTAKFGLGAVTLVAGTALSYVGGVYKKFVAADTDAAAFVWPNDVTLDASDNALGEIMVKGEIKKFSEIEALVEASDRAALLASCKDGLLAKGIVVRGISNINQ